MTRSTERRLGGPNFGTPQQGSTQRLQVNAPINVRVAPSSAERLADVLDNAWRSTAAPRLLDKIAKEGADARTAGAFDAETGAVDPKRAEEDRQYERGVAAIETRKRVAEFKAQAEERLLEEGTADLSAEELAAKLDGYAREAFGTMKNDPLALEFLVPELSQYLNNRVAQHLKQRVEQNEQEAIDGVGIDLADKARDGTLTADIVNDRLEKLRHIVGGNRAREVVVSQIGELAVSTGNPAILDTLVEQIQAGDSTVPGPAGVPRLGRLIQQYRREAESVRDNNLREVAIAKSRETERALFGRAARGLDLTDDVIAAVEAGDMSPDAGRTFLNFAESQRDERQRGFAIPSEVASIESRVIAGEFNTDPSAVLSLRGQIGAGHVANNESMRLYQLAVRMRDGDDKLDASGKLFRDTVRRALEPARNLATGAVEPNGVVRQNRAILEFDELVEKGQSPEQAAAEVLRKRGVDINVPPAPAAQTSTTPAVGTRREGADGVFEFIGGDPADRNSWRKVA